MLMTLYDLLEFKVVDDSTGQELQEVRWIDSVRLEVAITADPPRFVFGTFNLAVDVRKVSRVSVDYVNKVVHLNEPPQPVPALQVRELHACTECCQEATCRRIDYCAQYRCAFGEAKKP